MAPCKRGSKADNSSSGTTRPSSLPDIPFRHGLLWLEEFGSPDIQRHPFVLAADHLIVQPADRGFLPDCLSESGKGIAVLAIAQDNFPTA